MVTPSCPVTTAVMVLAPTLSAMGVDAVPVATETLLTFTVALALLVVGVTVMDVVA